MKNNNMKDFCKEHNITENQFKGIDKIEGNLDLRSLTSIPEGFNPTVGGYLDLRSLTSIPEGFNPTVGGSLDLRSLTSIPEGFNPTVGNSLWLGSLTSIPEGFNPIVGGYLVLYSLKSIPEGFNPTVGGSLYLESLKSIPEGFNPTVGGTLCLNSLTSIPEGFNPTVGGSLYLNSLKSIPDTFNPTVGGSLCLHSLTFIPNTFNPTVGYDLWLDLLTLIPEGFNPTVGGWLHLPKGLKCNKTELPSNYLFSWQDGKYIKVDGIFTEVVKQKGNVYHVKKINDDKIFYLITDGERWSHGDTLKEAKEDLIYKVTNKTKDDYKHLNKTSILTFEEAVVCYRVITGACSFGVKDFVKNKLDKVEKEYSIETIIEKTFGCYGNENFKEYFKK
jgi:hypothetical protein